MMAPTLIKLYVEQALKMWKKKLGKMRNPHNNTNMYTLSFADDQIIMA